MIREICLKNVVLALLFVTGLAARAAGASDFGGFSRVDFEMSCVGMAGLPSVSVSGGEMRASCTARDFRVDIRLDVPGKRATFTIAGSDVPPSALPSALVSVLEVARMGYVVEINDGNFVTTVKGL